MKLNEQTIGRLTIVTFILMVNIWINRLEEKEKYKVL